MSSVGSELITVTAFLLDQLGSTWDPGTGSIHNNALGTGWCLARLWHTHWDLYWGRIEDSGNRKKIIEDCSQLIKSFWLWTLLLKGISPGTSILVLEFAGKYSPDASVFTDGLSQITENLLLPLGLVQCKCDNFQLPLRKPFWVLCKCS